MCHSCFIHSSIDGHLGCFHILVIVNNTAMNIRMLMFLGINVWGSFRYIPRSGIAGSKHRSIFNFLKYLHTAFYSGRMSQAAKIEEDTKKKAEIVLARLWRKGNPSAVLVRMQTSAATLESSVEILQKSTKWICLLTQPFHFWEYIQRNSKH